MIVTGNVQARKFQNVFKKPTRISVQVTGAAVVNLSREQGEAQNVNDGINLTAASTNPPYETWWQGQLWYRASVDNTPFVLLILTKGEQC